MKRGVGVYVKRGDLFNRKSIQRKVFQLRRGIKVDDSIGWEKAFEDTHTRNFTRKKDLGKQVK